MDYYIYRSDVFDRFRFGGAVEGNPHAEGLSIFVHSVRDAFVEIGEAYGCEVQISEKRLREAYTLWIHDVSKLNIDQSADPNHLKLCGFLAYWLRRRMVIGICLPKTRERTRTQEQFATYCCELSAFLFCFRLALFFEMEKRGGQDQVDLLKKIILEAHYLRDVGVLLFEKNLSPHALYLIYRSLFYALELPRPENKDRVLHIVPPARL